MEAESAAGLSNTDGDPVTAFSAVLQTVLFAAGQFSRARRRVFRRLGPVSLVQAEIYLANALLLFFGAHP
jgi:hypothetical protein